MEHPLTGNIRPGLIWPMSTRMARHEWSWENGFWAKNGGPLNYGSFMNSLGTPVPKGMYL